MTEHSTAAVVGGGMAGMAAAYELKQAGFQVTVFETRDRVGGRIWTVRRGDFLMDLGTAYLGTYRKAVAMIHEVGLSNEFVETPVIFGMPRQGRSHYLDLAKPIRSCLTTGVISWPTKIKARKLFADVFKHRASLGNDTYAELAEIDTETRARIQPAGTEQGSGAVCSGAADQRHLGARRQRHLGRLAALDVSQRARKVGIQSDIRRGRTAEQVDRGLYESARYHRLGNVSLGFSARPDDPGTFSMISPYDDPDTIAVIADHNKAPGRAPADKGLISVLLSQAFLDRTDDRDDDYLLDHALDRVKYYYGKVPGTLEQHAVVRWPESVPVIDKGRFKRIAAFRRSTDGASRVQFASDRDRIPGLNGALVSGQEAAARVSQFIANRPAKTVA
jgi:protoporphyrinogen oxidase